MPKKKRKVALDTNAHKPYFASINIKSDPAYAFQVNLDILEFEQKEKGFFLLTKQNGDLCYGFISRSYAELSKKRSELYEQDEINLNQMKLLIECANKAIFDNNPILGILHIQNIIYLMSSYPFISSPHKLEKLEQVLSCTEKLANLNIYPLIQGPQEALSSSNNDVSPVGDLPDDNSENL